MYTIKMFFPESTYEIYVGNDDNDDNVIDDNVNE